eukprot:2710449-Amphidinium_carterae.1
MPINPTPQLLVYWGQAHESKLSQHAQHLALVTCLSVQGSIRLTPDHPQPPRPPPRTKKSS